MNIRKKFLELTSSTYPHGDEHLIMELLPNNLHLDEHGNLYVQVGYSDTMFTSHLDTYGYLRRDVVHVIEDNKIMTDGKSILGADDKAGVVILLNMIEKSIPGLYYFFLGEERGCLGSKKTAKTQKKRILPHIKKVISFDKRGTSSIATHQRHNRCCSDIFANALADKLFENGLDYQLDDKAGSTDSLQFIGLYPECTNLSVGYYNEHTFNEYQDMDHLERLANACLEIDWDELPVERTPEESKITYDIYGYGYGYY